MIRRNQLLGSLEVGCLLLQFKFCCCAMELIFDYCILCVLSRSLLVFWVEKFCIHAIFLECVVRILFYYLVLVLAGNDCRSEIQSPKIFSFVYLYIHFINQYVFINFLFWLKLSYHFLYKRLV